MEWFARNWLIDDENGEKEFLQQLFNTEEVLDSDEYVSNFTAINMAGDYYSVDVVSIEEGRSEKLKYFSFPSHEYKPQRIEQHDNTIVVHDTTDLLVTNKVIPNSNIKGGLDVAVEVMTDYPFYFIVRPQYCYTTKKGVYFGVQTISNLFYVKICDNPKRGTYNYKAEEPVSKKYARKFSITKTYTLPDDTGRCTLLISLECQGKVATIECHSLTKNRKSTPGLFTSSF